MRFRVTAGSKARALAATLLLESESHDLASLTGLRVGDREAAFGDSSILEFIDGG
ncbi:hypothetical protein [Streptacidiphilus sp. EB103A]|uniref:hypothetical protein n=1 Tax=Streptacidiphilus sp. EB103A TaxID=3156275 RepID=UPI003519B067